MLLWCAEILGCWMVWGKTRPITSSKQEDYSVMEVCVSGKTSLCLLETHTVIDIMPVALALVVGLTAFLSVFEM